MPSSRLVGQLALLSWRLSIAAIVLAVVGGIGLALWFGLSGQWGNGVHID